MTPWRKAIASPSRLGRLSAWGLHEGVKPMRVEGRRIKGGAGALTLSGDSSGFTGSTRLEFGRLIVDGRLEVEANAMLAGRGAVGATRVAPGGIIAPGPGSRC
jgi:autotransporter-associated beta strand protein